ncbi:YIP1 family protein [Paenibacillus sp.]|uniref:YIP1 family protein n=1 Tax=Paenibacillus sp. TaxID=58172 RepID=UPI002D72F9E6|nr:YIP1 family protein [Paenibacillus sp.]HZG85876.1 YIP1 family protein [Paenibacillus sp.]
MILKRGGWRLILALVVVCTAMLPASAFADVKYSTYTRNSYGHLVYLQPAYFPVGVIGADLYVTDPNDPGVRTVSSLKEPKDLFIDGKDEIYIADTGNNRIVHLSSDGTFLRYLTSPEDPFNKPEGVFVTEDGDIFVADTGNKRVLRLDQNGHVKQKYERPDSKFISDSFVFTPVKLIVDKRGFLYVASQGSYEGVLVLDPEGRFQGFFGTNRTVLTPLEALKKWLYTDAMYEREVLKRPETINSLTTDGNGYIYTVTGGSARSNQLKKLNTRGINLLRGSTGSFGEYLRSDARTSVVNPAARWPQLIDVAVDRNGNIAVADKQFKYITHYDPNGNLLYFWGGPSDFGTSQVGLMKNPVALDFNSKNELYVLDDQENIVQKFRMSEFAQLVDRANQLTLSGFYEEGEQLWREVLRMNPQFNPAILALAQAAYKNEQFEEAKQLFREAGDKEGYSEAYWQIRLRWFQQYFSWIASGVLALFVLLQLFDKWTKKRGGRGIRRNRNGRQLPEFALHMKHAFRLLKHPIDGFTALRYEGQGSYWSAILILLLVYASMLFREFHTSFVFNNALRVNVYTIFTQFFVVWIAWVAANHLVSSIYRGEGRLRDIFIGSAYAMVPYIVVGVPLTIVSNVMTLSESSVYQFVDQGMILWVALLIFWKVQFIHNYSVGETLMNIILTLATMLVLGLLIFIMVGLTRDLISFVLEVLREVALR